MKILLVTNKVKTYALGFRNVIETLTELGHQVVWAADFSGFAGDLSEIPCKQKQIPIHSNPLKPTNLQALKMIKDIITQENIEAVHCSTPIGGMLARLAAKQKGVKKIIYAAHGFLFFKGAPLLNRTVYKWQEQLMARWTDVLITITEEDRQAAGKFRLRSGKEPYLVHGAGVENSKTVTVDRKRKRQQLGIPEDAFVVLSAGFLNENKNNRVVIEAVKKLHKTNVHYVICGEGKLRTKLEKLAADLGIENQVHLLGYRTDMAEIMATSDLFVMPSFREGVPRALLEAMDAGIPCIGSDTRGIRELLSKEALCDPKDAAAFADRIVCVKNGAPWVKDNLQKNRETAKKYSKEQVRQELLAVYQEVL